MRRIQVGPFNRVEGDLEVTLDIADGVVREARVTAPLYRGFEQILLGKAPEDALVFVPRICGICSVAQSAAAALALAEVQGIEPPPNGRLAANLTLAAENIADHLTHFYLFFMPDFARPAYRQRTWHGAAEGRFKAVTGSAGPDVLAARSAFMRAMGLLAGKWPHTLSLQPGGSSAPLQASEKIRLVRLLRDFRRFLESTLFGDTLEAFAALDSREALVRWQEGRRGDAATFLSIAADLGLDRFGRATDVFMSVGAYPDGSGRWFPAGVWAEGAVRPLDIAAIREDVSHAWYLDGDQPMAPAAGTTLPQADKSAGYSWCKAPRLGNAVVEVGALSRQVVAGHPLARDLVTGQGGNALSRVVGRLLEMARLLPAMESWAEALKPGEPYCIAGTTPEAGQGVGLIEAARGSLGHWLTIRHGHIQNYQIVAPTTWNFSPRDERDVPGALEQALVGIPMEASEESPILVQHVVRSFDPCMVCTVH